mmetsp:Transcript_14958/g.64732  ORF Transcript_14958/g.64732 Transcript_14958/m.64732 type:complete len:243 (+) Transcript_14958:1109-1837(+)
MLISRARRSAALRRPGGVVIAPKPSDNAVALAVDLASSRVRSSLSRLESAGRSTTLRTAMPAAAGGRPSTPPSPSTPAPRPGSFFAAVARRKAPRASTACDSDPAVATNTLSVPVPVRGPFMILVSAERRQSGTSPWESAARARVSWPRLNRGVDAVFTPSPPTTSTTRAHRRRTVRRASSPRPSTDVSVVVIQSSETVAAGVSDPTGRFKPFPSRRARVSASVSRTSRRSAQSTLVKSSTS